MREYQVLLVANADLAMAVTAGKVRDGLHLPRGGVARRLADGLQRKRHDGVARHFVPRHRVPVPQREAGIGPKRCPERLRLVLQLLVFRIDEARADVRDQRRIELQIAVLDLRPLLLNLGGEALHAKIVHQELHARLVDVVAAAIGVVDAQNRFEVAQQVLLGQEVADRPCR